MEPNLIFNILTFDWPTEPVTMYFTDQETDRSQKLHFTLFPNDAESLFPNLVRNGNDFLCTTFTGETEGFKPLSIDFEKENPDLIKRYYNRQLNFYFRSIQKQIVKVGFIKENQIWIKSQFGSNTQWNIYEKFSVKVQLCTVSKYPEILLSYDGQSKVLKKSVAELIQSVSPTCFNWVLHEKQLFKWERIQEDENIDFEQYYPVLNKTLATALGVPTEAPPRDNRYPKYLKKIQGFYKKFIDTDKFREFIPLHEGGFINVNATKVNSTSAESNQLVFGNNTPDTVPKYALKKHKPFKPSPYKNIHLFFILHNDDKDVAVLIKNHFEKGFKWFKGLYDYAKLLFHTEGGFSIVFQDKENPIVEIEQKLSERDINPDVKYIAIYITPYSKFEHDKEKREIYYQLKELLLKRKITSQVIDSAKMREQGDNWVYSLPNIAVAMLAKLDGIPWRLNTPERNELIVGVGAFKHVDEGVQYIGSAFSFANNGKFNRFEYFLKDEVDLLAGSIANSIREYATVNEEPERLIIHFYKSMSEKELEPILRDSETLGLPIPVFIITINKTEAEDIVAFDNSWEHLMPHSGTYINIGGSKYLLFNNTRYGDTHSSADGYPFPIKLKIQCTDEEQLQEVRVVKELIDQVYQFSRMYWKSIRQQNLPVTIKYPEMVAQIAPHFVGEEIPAYGKDNLWFL